MVGLLLQISIPVQPVLVEAQELPRFLRRDLAGADGFLHVLAHRGRPACRPSTARSAAPRGRVSPLMTSSSSYVAVVQQADVDGVGVAEAGCAGRRGSPDRRRAGTRRGSTARRVKGCSSSVLRTSRRSMNWSILPSESQVMSPSTARRVGASFEPMDRHDREELLDRPASRASTGRPRSCRSRCRTAACRGPAAPRARSPARGQIRCSLRHDRPEQPLGQGPQLDRQVAEVEQVQRLVHGLHGVVVALRGSSSWSGRGGWRTGRRSAAGRRRAISAGAS